MNSPEPAGTLLADRYRVEELVGRGGMAMVYRVLDERLGQRVALKRCFAREPSKRARHAALLEREYHTLAQLAHPHIIQVHDFGVDAHGPYYTMELLDPSDLERVERLSWQETSVVLRDVASALAMLHSRGLIHRDVSLRNVHWHANGRAKLIDFGAMVSMGVCKDSVGTPPFMAPETLQLQALDGRVDLFALGALGYRLLTGRHAFQARRFSDLRDAWRSRPVFSSSLDPAVPAELSGLILRMLSLDRAARPHRAGEVLERLRTFAPSAHEDVAGISRAYLTTPKLVGRESALVAIRKHMLALVRGDGGRVVIRGATGSGRSRVLDAFALEGKLLNAIVVRSDARDSSTGEWGVARALGSQLIAQFPKQAEDAARLSRNVLGHVLEELADEHFTDTALTPERELLVRELRDWMLSLAKHQRLLILVDDVDRIDAPSLALLLAIAYKAERRPVLLAVSAVDDPQHPPSTSLQRLQTLSSEIALSQLQAAQTEALFRSLFGDIPNLPLCAARVHGLSQGNPRATMELAQHLLDTGRAGYEAGTWTLPAKLDENDLPLSLSDSLLTRLRELSADARELADALALTDEDGLPLASYAALTQHADAPRAFKAQGELIAARILSADGERVHFTQRGLLAVLLENMPEERRRGLHVRIANLLNAKGGDMLRRAHHMLAGGMDLAAIELLAGLESRSQLPPATLLSTAIKRAQQLGVPAVTLHRLRMGLLIAAPYAMDYAAFRRVAPLVLARLEHDSGLARYRELTHLPDAERLTQALRLTQEAYLAAPEHERVLPVVEAIRELARVSYSIPNMAVTMFDLEILDTLPALEPLYSLSPGLPIVGQVVAATKHWVRGGFLQARAIYDVILTRITQPDRAGLDDAQHERVRLAMHWIAGLADAAYGIGSAEQHAAQLEERRESRVNAWRVRAIYQLALGDTTAASKSLRRAELLQVNEGIEERYVNSTTGMELLLRSRLGDLLGVKALLPTLAWLATQYPGWRPVEMLGRSRYHELQGDLQTAHMLAAAGLETVRPGEHPFFSSLAASHVGLTALLGRLPDAVAYARRYLEISAQHGLQSPDLPLRAALVLAQAGAFDEAEAVLVPQLREAEVLGREGLAAGALYEVRARVALAAGDRDAFETWLARCAAAYEKSRNPALLAQAAQLLEDAKQLRLVAREAAETIHRSLQPPAAGFEYDTLHSRMGECLDRDDRARAALTLLMQDTLSNLGYLYGADEDQNLTLLAALPDAPLDPGVVAWVQAYAQAWTEKVDTQDGDERSNTQTSDALTETHSQTESGDARDAAEFVDAEGTHLQALPLLGGSARGSTLAAVLVLELTPGQPFAISHALTGAIARELLSHGDVAGWQLDG